MCGRDESRHSSCECDELWHTERLRGLIEGKVRNKVQLFGSSHQQLVVDITSGSVDRGMVKLVLWHCPP
jgi:hypothetical protein